MARKAALLLCLFVLALPAAGWAGNFGLGGGVRYNVMLGSLSGAEFDRNFLSYLFSAKYQMLNFLAVEATADYYPGSGDIDYIFRPTAAVILGNFINVGLGITTSYNKTGSGSEWSDPWFQLQAGVQIPIASYLWINADAYYLVQKINDVTIDSIVEKTKDFDSDSIIFGTRLHIRF